MSGPEFNPADDEPIDREEWEKWEREKCAMSDPKASEKRLEQIERAMQRALENDQFGSKSYPWLKEYGDWLIQTVRAQAQELAALKEPMVCTHPKACIVYRREIPQNANEPEIETCAWCESLKALRERAEQAETQLAGCGVAALGGTKDPAKKGDWGWSASYQDVLDLRLKFEALKAERDRLAEENWKMREVLEKIDCGCRNSATFADILAMARKALSAQIKKIGQVTVTQDGVTISQFEFSGMNIYSAKKEALCWAKEEIEKAISFHPADENGTK